MCAEASETVDNRAKSVRNVIMVAIGIGIAVAIVCAAWRGFPFLSVAVWYRSVEYRLTRLGQVWRYEALETSRHTLGAERCNFVVRTAVAVGLARGCSIAVYGMKEREDLKQRKPRAAIKRYACRGGTEGGEEQGTDACADGSRAHEHKWSSRATLQRWWFAGGARDAQGSGKSEGERVQPWRQGSRRSWARPGRMRHGPPCEFEAITVQLEVRRCGWTSGSMGGGLGVEWRKAWVATRC